MSFTLHFTCVILLCIAAATEQALLRNRRAIQHPADKLRGGAQLPRPLPSILTPDLDAYRVHAFYYLWYGNPETDGKFLHWNHKVLPHWDPQIAQGYPSGTRFQPPDHLHCPFYPAKGPYSSSSLATIKAQMREMTAAGIQVLVVSWWGPHWRSGSADTQGVHTDLVLPLVMRAAEEEGGIRVALHLEPYPGRNVSTVPEDLRYLMRKYGSSPALLRVGDGRPLYYVYDSYHISAADWWKLLQPGGGRSIRGTEIDGFFLGLWVHAGDGSHQIEPAGFDGFYTYFASESTSFASNPHNWPSLQRWAERHGKLFVPSVGPGYSDIKIRPWNGESTRPREAGLRYSRFWEKALDVNAGIVSITSWNEWGEGTQIEPARVFTPPDAEYEQYGPRPGDEYLYLRLTRTYANELSRRLDAARPRHHLHKGKQQEGRGSGGSVVRRPTPGQGAAHAAHLASAARAAMHHHEHNPGSKPSKSEL